MPKKGGSLSKSGKLDLRACTECRKRKSKCSGTSPCAYCARTKKSCVFGPAPSRTPLTRKNLDAAELRCARLASLIARLRPNLDVEGALNATTRSPEGDFSISIETSQDLESERESAAAPDEFEWRESSLTSPSRTNREPLDGMASLPTAGTESGYLGNSSGSTLLKTISDLIPENHRSRAQLQEELASPPNTNFTGSPSVSINLANSPTLECLIDAYFKWYNPSYPILHERIFREKYQNRHQMHRRSSWHPIFFLVLAIGQWLLSEGSETEQPRYYTSARSHMSMAMLESGTLLNVQAFLLMGNYLQKLDRPNTGYSFIGIAYRMALGLGLHREPPPAMSTDTLLNERRRVVWWIVYCFDSGFSLTTGRPVMVSDSFIETRFPQNIDDSACTLDSILPSPTERATTYSAITAQARLASIGNLVFNELISSTSKGSWDLRNSRSIDNQFKAWKLSLPPYFTAHDVPDWFRGPRAIVIWKEQNLRIMMWWGSQRMCHLSDQRDEAQNMCHFTAVETIQEIITFCHENPDILHTSLSWYATYFLFQAAVVLSIHYLRPRGPVGIGSAEISQELWLSSFSRSRDCLASLSRTNKAAMRCLAVLDRIRDRSQPSQPTTAAQTDLQPNSMEVDAVPDNGEVHSAALAVDPTLQMFFEDTFWDINIFEGLNGFPSTGEVGPFEYLPVHHDQAWFGPSDPGLQPT